MTPPYRRNHADKEPVFIRLDPGSGLRYKYIVRLSNGMVVYGRSVKDLEAAVIGQASEEYPIMLYKLNKDDTVNIQGVMLMPGTGFRWFTRKESIGGSIC